MRWSIPVIPALISLDKKIAYEFEASWDCTVSFMPT